MKFRPLFTLILLASLLAALLGLARVQVAHAQSTITVSTCDESHLDTAITQANSDNAGDTITFSCSGDIKLTSTLTITGSMILNGNGQSVTLDGQNAVEVFFVNGGVTFTLKALNIAHGSASGGFDGGGLYNNGSVSISNSTFAYNSDDSGTFGGGGIFNNSGTVSISNSTFAYNSASQGGGISNLSGTVSISNSTFAKNSATFGGGLRNDSGTVSISNSTFAYNSASQGGGGGGLSTQSNGTLSIGGSIVADNAGGNCQSGFSDQGYNLESATDCGFTGTGDLQNTDPKLDPNGLQNNGGPTQTIALQQGSPAIDQIPAAHCPATDQDQRGVSRPDDTETTCDIGAYESTYADSDLSLSGLPANITTNATSSQGAVVTYNLPTAVDEDSPLPSVSCMPASGSTFAIGTTTVTCTVSDSDDTPSAVSQTFTVTVKGAVAQVNDLISLVNSFHLSSSLQTALDNKLQDVLTAINAGQTATACSELTDFIGHVQSQSGKGLTQSQATQLITAAQRIQAVLGC